jgi:hypothetical protein
MLSKKIRSKDAIIPLILSISGMIFSLYWVLAEWSLAYTENKRTDLYLILSISRMIFTLY